MQESEPHVEAVFVTKMKYGRKNMFKSNLQKWDKWPGR